CYYVTMDIPAQEQSSSVPMTHRFIPILSGIAVLAVSLLVLVGWVINNSVFIRILPNLPSMSPLSASSFAVTSVSFLLAMVAGKRKWPNYLSALLALLVMAVM